MNRFRCLFTSFLLSWSVILNAYDFSIGGIYYNYTANNELEVTSGENLYNGSVVIPNNVDVDGKTYAVTRIGDRSFEDCVSLTSITIPNSITSIGTLAFRGCENLGSVYITDISAWCNIYFSIEGSELAPISVSSNPLIYADALYLNGELVDDLVIPDNVTRINRNAFFAYDGLTSVEMPNSVTDVGMEAFCRCSNLKSVILSSSMTMINQGVFSRTGLTNVTIPEGITSLETWSFDNCPELTTVILPSTLTGLGDYVFDSCTSLAEIILPESVTSMGRNVFANTALFNNQTAGVYLGCWLLGYNGGIPDEFVITNGTKYIANYAFYKCSTLTSVTIPESVASIGRNAFYDCSSLTSVTIGSGVTNIGYNAFSDCSNLKDVHISDLSAWCNIDFVSNPLSNANNLYMNGELVTELVIPDGVTEIKDYAFSGFSSLTSVTIPSSVTSIENYAFSGCSNLKDVHISDLSAWCNIDFVSNPLSNANNLYMNGELVTELVIPDGVTEIKDYAFSGFSSLTSVTIPSSVTSIECYAFSGCSNLKDVHISDLSAWCNIDFVNNPLSNAGNLYLNGELITDLVIPDGVTEIKDYAFSGFSSLTSVTIPNSVTSIGERVFSGCSGLTSVTIGSGVTAIKDYVFSGCSGLTSITIPNSVTSVGNGAFSGCSNLNEVHISDLSAWCNIDFVNSPLSNTGNLYLNGELVTDLVIPDGVTEIKDYAFSGFSSLTSVTIPNSVTSIGEYAFDGCRALTSVTIGSGVTSIGNDAFHGCNKITSISSHIPAENLTEISDFSRSFYRRCTLYVPFGATEVYASTSGWDGFVNIVEMDFTDIDEVKEQKADVRVIYDLQGRVVDTPAKGIYIINGKQVLIK